MVFLRHHVWQEALQAPSNEPETLSVAATSACLDTVLRLSLLRIEFLGHCWVPAVLPAKHGV